MTRAPVSQSWYRVAGLRPKLKSQVEIHRHTFRGEPWYVIQDHASGQFQRFSLEANAIIGQMDGRRTMQEIWERAAAHLGEDLPTQDEVIRLLAQLHAADLLAANVPPDVAEIAERSASLRRREFLQKVRNPLAVRVPVLDPDRFLAATVPFVRPLFHPLGFAAWVGLIAFALVEAGIHWSALTENVADRVLAAENVLAIALTYPVIKALHELGHGYAVRAWGGEVHEMGVMFLVLVPVPYVDASASSAFPNKWRRATVAAAGIMVEGTLAAGALFLWLAAEPGLARALFFNVMLIAGVSTVLFNGNPLLRFDGYYVLADLVEIPNLATRANRYVLYLIQRYLFGVDDLPSAATARGERAWLVLYGLGSLTYRLFIMTAIVLFLASRLFIIGVLLAIWAAVAMLGVPAAKGLWFLLMSPVLRNRRGRAAAVTGAVLAAALGFFLLVPLPHGTVVKGVVWVPEDAVVRVRTDGYVARLLARPNAVVRRGDPLVEMRDPVLEAQLAVAEAALREYRNRLAAVDLTDPVQAAIVREQVVEAAALRDRLAERAAGLTVRSGSVGRFVVPEAADLIGRFADKGTRLGFVVDAANPIVRVAIAQDDIDLVRTRLRAVTVRIAGRLAKTVPARVRRAAPAASHELSTAGLGTEGGGDVAMDPSHPGRTLASIFELDLALRPGDAPPMIGRRAYVRFDHGDEPIAPRLYRRIRQLFLSEFNV